MHEVLCNERVDNGSGGNWYFQTYMYKYLLQVPKCTWEYMQIGGSLYMVVCRIYKLVQSVSAWEYFQVKRVEWQSWQKVAAAAIQQQSAASCLTGALPALIYPNLSNRLQFPFWVTVYLFCNA